MLVSSAARLRSWSSWATRGRRRPPFEAPCPTIGNPTDGYTLKEALKRFADPAKWQAYERDRRAAGSRRNRQYSMTFRGEPIAGWAAAEEMKRSNALIEQRERAWRDLCFDLISRLRSGELIATGLEEPLTLDRARRPIPVHLWQVLRPDFKHSAAVGGGLKISGILVRRATEADQEPTAVSTTVEELPEPDPDVIPEARPPGRPSMMPKIEAEMRRRAAVRPIARRRSAPKAKSSQAGLKQRILMSALPGPSRSNGVLEGCIRN